MFANIDKRQLMMLAMILLMMGLELPSVNPDEGCKMVLMINQETNVSTQFIQCYQ